MRLLTPEGRLLRRSTRFPPLLAFLLLAYFARCALAIDLSPAELSFPKQIRGDWRVKSVLVDLGFGRRMEYERDDARLVGRSFSIEPYKINDNAPEARECVAPKFLHRSVKLSELLTLTFAPRGESKKPPGLRDFEIPVSGDPLVDAFFVECKRGRFGPRLPKEIGKLSEGNAIGTWVVRLPAGLLALRWFDETILILDPVMH